MYTAKHVGGIINAFLVCISTVFIWYAVFYLKVEEKFLILEGFKAKYHDSITPFSNHYIVLASFASIFFAISVYGYMTADDISAYEVAKEIIFLLINIILEFSIMYYFYRNKVEKQEQMADHMYNGVVLNHEARKNESNDLLQRMYDKINDPKWRCCGIYSWKDAESFRPRACCPRGYTVEQGRGLCHPRYGAHPTSCTDIRRFILDRLFNRFILYLTALMLFQFLGIVLCGMHLIMIIQISDAADFRREKKVNAKN